MNCYGDVAPVIIPIVIPNVDFGNVLLQYILFRHEKLFNIKIDLCQRTETGLQDWSFLYNEVEINAEDTPESMSMSNVESITAIYTGCNISLQFAL